MPEVSRWHIGREIPIAVVVMLIAQTGGLIWWARGEVAQRERLEQRQVEHAARIATLEAQRVGERMLVLEAQMSDAKELLRRIDDRTQRLVERQRQEGGR